MEDIWIHSVSDATPLWLTDASVRKGIHGMLRIDQCNEEQRRLGMEAGMCAWFGCELYSPGSKYNMMSLHLKLHSASKARTFDYG